MSESPTPDAEFADELAGLYEAAGSPKHAGLVRQAAAQRSPVGLNVKTLSDWFAGKSVPAEAAAVRFLVEFLQPRAIQRAGYQPHALNWWLDLHQRAQRERQASRGSRQRVRFARTAPATAGNPVVPRQLPTAPSGFAGRTSELAELTSLLEHPVSGMTVVISAVDGMAGIGKTALAVCWAHRVAKRFPDGQLYVNLRGFDPAGPPMSPAEAVQGFLDAFGVPAERIPFGLEAQTGLYRSILAGRRVLVVLDNARDAAQVRPLLPGSPGCMVLVTSRIQLTSLIAAEGARPLTVDLLPVAEARELLAHRLGSDRVAAEPAPALEIITSCGRLPLALSIAAARAALHPEFPLAALAAELRETSGGLHAFDGGEATVDVRAVFSWSYQRLAPKAARIFRLLGLHPGPDITISAAASLVGDSLIDTRHTLLQLARYHLVTERVPGRFSFHDLLRAYAAELAARHDTDDERTEAQQRLLDYYLHNARAANRLLHPRWEPITLAPPSVGVVVEELADNAASWGWFEAEYAVLLGTITLAADTGHHRYAWQLVHELTEFFARRGHWADWVATGNIALRAAHHCGDLLGQAHTLGSLGQIYQWTGRFDEANNHLRQAVDLFAELGDTVGQGESYIRLAAMFERQGKTTDSLAAAQQALELFRVTGWTRGVALAFNDIGSAYADLGQGREALIHCQQALALFREVGDRRGEWIALDGIGHAHNLLGQHDQAIDYLHRALAIVRDLHDQYGVAVCLDRIGDVQCAAGDQAAAHDVWQRAVAILDQFGVVRTGPDSETSEADWIRAKIRRPEL